MYAVIYVRKRRRLVCGVFELEAQALRVAREMTMYTTDHLVYFISKKVDRES